MHGYTALHTYIELSDTKELLVCATTLRTSGAEQEAARTARSHLRDLPEAAKLWRQKTEELTTKTQRRRGGMAETVPVLVSVFVRLHVFVSQRNQAGGPTLPTFKTHHRGQQHRKAGTVPHL